MSAFEGLRSEITDKLSPQSMRLLCGEMSAAEMRTAQALMKWVLRMCDRYEAGPASGGLDPDLARMMARNCVARARRSHPDSLSAAALRSVEEEIALAFSPDSVARHQQAASAPQ